MRRMLFAALLFNVLLVGSTGAALAQSIQTRSTQPLPPGRQLLAAMQAAVQAKGGYHLQGAIVVQLVAGVQENISMRADVSNRTNQAHVMLMASIPSGSQQVEEVLVGRRLAIRSGHGAWQCHPLKSIVQLSQSLVGTPEVARAQTLGYGLLNGTPVWRVRATVSLSLLGQPQRVAETFFISRSDHTLLQVKSSPVLNLNGITAHERLLIVYSRYGESVHVALPPACR